MITCVGKYKFLFNTGNKRKAKGAAYPLDTSEGKLPLNKSLWPPGQVGFCTSAREAMGQESLAAFKNGGTPCRGANCRISPLGGLRRARSALLGLQALEQSPQHQHRRHGQDDLRRQLGVGQPVQREE